MITILIPTLAKEDDYVIYIFDNFTVIIDNCTDLVDMLKDKIENHLSVARVPLTVADVHQAHYVRVAVFT